METLLDEKDLLKYVEKELATIQSESPATVHTTREKKCRSLLIQFIADNQLEYVKDKKAAKDVFDTLRRVYERNSVASQLYLRKKLMTLRYDEGTDIASHFLEFDRTVRELKSIGGTVEPMDIVCYLLLSLPCSYEAVVTALETMDPERLTVDFVKNRLLDECAKRTNVGNRGEKNGVREGVAMNANTRRFKCYACGEAGHKKHECPNVQKAQSKQAHIASSNGTGASSVSFVACAANDITAIAERHAERTASSECVREVRFILDSGCTEHMTNDESVFASARVLETPEQIAVAKNGISLEANKTGSIIGELSADNVKTPCTIKNVLFVEELKCNLLSVSKLEEAGMSVVFANGQARICRNENVIAVAVRKCNV